MLSRVYSHLCFCKLGELVSKNLEFFTPSHVHETLFLRDKLWGELRIVVLVKEAVSGMKKKCCCFCSVSRGFQLKAVSVNIWNSVCCHLCLPSAAPVHAVCPMALEGSRAERSRRAPVPSHQSPAQEGASPYSLMPLRRYCQAECFRAELAFSAAWS